jgi:NADH:ubiquinone oxidoreductase subunit 5 (subunit L)/multisubunit Na+/H+ antiporter MnhA subunit
VLHASFFYSLNFATGSALIGFFPSALVEVMAVLLFIGAVGKSAQIGLHT